MEKLWLLFFQALSTHSPKESKDLENQIQALLMQITIYI